MAIRGNFSNKEVKFIQLYTNLYFIDKWGFVKNAVDTNGVYHDVTKISTDTSCSSSGCTLTETIGIDLSLDFLKNNQNGFEIKAFGTREKIINVPSVMIKSFLKAYFIRAFKKLSILLTDLSANNSFFNTDFVFFNSKVNF